MGYNPLTRSKHNMFDIASLLQKAIRRGDAERAGYAAYELFGSYETFLWKRLFVVSSEDTWGVVTKEIMDLYKKHAQANAGKKGYDKDPTYASEAVDLLCKSKKSRDACYFACNFILSNNMGDGTEGSVDTALEIASQTSYGGYQTSLFESASQKDMVAAKIAEAIINLDMENTGAAVREMMYTDESYLWKVFRYTDRKISGGILEDEINALQDADLYVNRTKKPDERDPIFISKAVMNMMYYGSGKYDTVCSEESIQYQGMIDWSGKESISIAECRLPDGIIPEYVYDVHTIKGKRNGATDWGMNLVENDALCPFQKAFFEEGSWEMRYDYKHEHGLCSEKEYQMSLEYRKTHESNPSHILLES